MHTLYQNDLGNKNNQYVEITSGMFCDKYVRYYIDMYKDLRFMVDLRFINHKNLHRFMVEKNNKNKF